MLMARVKEGMGLLIAAGNGWTPGRAGDSLESLTALPLRDAMVIKPGDFSRLPNEEPDPASFAGFMQSFADIKSFSGVKVRGYWIAEDLAKSDARVLARLGNQSPLVAFRQVGRGRLVLMTTSLDRDWSDLCLTPGFIPFLDRLF